MNKEYARVDVRERSGRLTIGVQIDRDTIRSVEVLNGRITSWAERAIPKGMSDAEELPVHLKRALEPFEPARRQARVWVLGAFPSLQVRFLSVPKTRTSQVSNVVYWQFRKEVPFDAALTAFDYDIEGENTQGDVPRLDVTAYTVSQAEVDALRSVFSHAGVRLDGVAIPHFAMRNLFQTRWITHEGTVLSLYVGDESTSLQIHSGGRVTLNRVFITGMNAMLGVLHNRHPEWTADDILARLNSVSEAESAEAREVVRPALGRLMQQVERSMASYLVGRSNEEIDCVHVMGALAAYPRLVEEMGAHWGLRAQAVHVMEPPHVASGVDLPMDPSSAALLSMAAGVALSDDAHTPNLLHTYVKRDRESLRRRTRSWATAGVGLLLLAFALSFGYLLRSNAEYACALRDIQAQASAYMPGLTRETITLLMASLEERHLQFRGVARNCRPIAVLNELAAVTPEDVRLGRIEIVLESPVDRERGAGARERRVQIEGQIRGVREQQESKLASYVIQLEDTRMFERVALMRSGPGRDGANPVILFALELHLETITDRPATGVTVAAKELP